MTYAFEADPIYCELVHLVINIEGKYVNDPDDPGGPTKFGIAWNFNRAALAKIGIATVEQLKEMTTDQAKQIYYDKYFRACGANLIPDKRLAYIHFDAAVNCGVGTAAKFMFRLSKNPKDFEGGGKNGELWFRLILEYVQQREWYYTHCKNNDKYIDGWINRLSRIIGDLLAMKP